MFAYYTARAQVTNADRTIILAHDIIVHPGDRFADVLGGFFTGATGIRLEVGRLGEDFAIVLADISVRLLVAIHGYCSACEVPPQNGDRRARPWD